MRTFLVLLSGCLFLSTQAATFPRIMEGGQADLRTGKADAAVLKFKEAVAKNPVHGDAWYSLGTAAYQAKQYDLGAEAYLKAAALGANPKDAFYDRACCLALAGKRKEAVESLVKSLELGFRDIWHVRTDEDVKPLLDDPRLKAMLYLEDVGKMNRDQGFRFDLKVLYSELKRLHYNPFHRHSESAMDAFVKKVHTEIPKLNDDQVVGKFMELAVMFGDAHTALRPGMAPNPAAGPATYLPRFWPIQVYAFEEGHYITSAAPEYADLAGGKLLEMNGKPIETCLKLLDPVISRDNEIWPKLIGPNLLGVARATLGVGITDSADETTLKVLNRKGETQVVNIKSRDKGVQPDWKLARDPAKPPINLKKPEVLWFEDLPDKKAFYIAYQAVQNQPQRTVAQFFDEAFAALDKSTAEVLILDMRRNGGGNNFLNKPLLQAILARPKINRKGKFFVIIGRNTFSAAVCGAGNLNRLTEAMFVGEPTGSPPNFIGETIPVTLPYSRLVATVSDLYWQNTVAMDERVWIAPDLYAPPSYKMLLEGRDPATEAIWEYLAEG